MNEETFYQTRSRDWERLNWLCNKSETGLKHLTSQELKEFVRLHRRASGDLATIRTRSKNEGLALYLNDLVSRSYGILYNVPHQNLFKLAFEGIGEIARAFRRNFAFVAASAGIFLFAWVFVFFLLSIRPDYRTLMIPAGSEGVFEQWKSGTGANRDLNENVLALSMYASHNPLVSIITGAVGAGSLGFLSIFMLWQNGMVIGALSHEMASVGKLGFLLSSIAPHGVPELSGIIVSAAAGLKFGWSVFFPGLRTRAESLKRAGKDGLALIIAGIVLCLIAAPIEGFFSFDPRIPQLAKVLLALVEVVAWSLFWTQFGRQTPGLARNSIE